jgi:hypothetical protein
VSDDHVASEDISRSLTGEKSASLMENEISKDISFFPEETIRVSDDLSSSNDFERSHLFCDSDGAPISVFDFASNDIEENTFGQETRTCESIAFQTSERLEMKSAVDESKELPVSVFDDPTADIQSDYPFERTIHKESGLLEESNPLTIPGPAALSDLIKCSSGFSDSKSFVHTIKHRNSVPFPVTDLSPSILDLISSSGAWSKVIPRSQQFSPTFQNGGTNKAQQSIGFGSGLAGAILVLPIDQFDDFSGSSSLLDSSLSKTWAGILLPTFFVTKLFSLSESWTGSIPPPHPSDLSRTDGIPPSRDFDITQTFLSLWLSLSSFLTQSDSVWKLPVFSSLQGLLDTGMVVGSDRFRVTMIHRSSFIRDVTDWSQS